MPSSTQQPARLKRGTRISYRYAGGLIVPGRIVRPAVHLGADWFEVRLTDGGGTYGGCVHRDGITVLPPVDLVSNASLAVGAVA